MDGSRDADVIRLIPETHGMFTAKETSWLTADGKTLVKAGDPKAAFLFAGKGQRIAEKKTAGIKNLSEFVTDSNADAQAAEESRVEKRVAERLAEEEKKRK